MSECPDTRPLHAAARLARHPDRRRTSAWVGNSGAIFLRMAGVSAAALLLANCAGQVEKQGANQDRFNKKYGVSSSPRVVRPGDPVPKGGGRAMLGKPYTVAGKRYTPVDNPNYTTTGVASWYGMNFHGRLTANGEVFDKHSIAAAHPTLPLPSYVRVTNLSNGLSMVVRVNDRGPYHGKRVIDVSRRAAELLEFRHMGTARVKVDFIRRASVNGSDDKILAASLSDGAPARLDGGRQTPVMLASARTPETHAAHTTHGQHAAPHMTARPDHHGPNETQVAAVSTHLAVQPSHMGHDGEEHVALPLIAPLPPVRPLQVASGN